MKLDYALIKAIATGTEHITCEDSSFHFHITVYNLRNPVYTGRKIVVNDRVIILRSLFKFFFCYSQSMHDFVGGILVLSYNSFLQHFKR